MLRLNWLKRNILSLRQSDQNAALAFAGNILRLALTFATSVITARLISQESYGQLMLLLGWGYLLYPLMSLGFDHSLIHFHSESKRISQAALLDSVFRFAIQGSIVVFGIIVIAGIAMSLILDPLGRYAEWRYPVVLLMLHMELWALGSIAVGLLRAHKDFKPGVIRESVLFPLLLLGSFLSLINQGHSGITAYCISLALATAISTGYLFWYVHRSGRLTVRQSESGTPIYSLRQRLAWGLHSFPNGCMGSLDLLIFWMPILVLGWHSPASEVASLAVCMRLGQLCHLGTVAIAPIAAPYLSDAWLLGRLVFNRAIGRFALQAGGAAICAAVVVVLLRNPLLALFGDAYTSSGILLIIVVFGFVVEAFLSPVRQALVALGNNRANMIFSAASILAIYLAALLLIAPYGAVGAALSMVIGTLVGAAGRLYWLLGIEHRRLS